MTASRELAQARRNRVETTITTQSAEWGVTRDRRQSWTGVAGTGMLSSLTCPDCSRISIAEIRVRREFANASHFISADRDIRLQSDPALSQAHYWAGPAPVGSAGRTVRVWSRSNESGPHSSPANPGEMVADRPLRTIVGRRPWSPLRRCRTGLAATPAPPCAGRAPSGCGLRAGRGPWRRNGDDG